MSTNHGCGALVAVVAVVTALTGVPWSVDPADAAVSGQEIRLLVDDLAFTGSDLAVGDGVCQTAAGTCTLRAAIEEANALGATNEVAIGVADNLQDTDGSLKSSGVIVATTSASTWMATSSVSGRSNWDSGAYYRLTAPMIVDLDHRIGLKAGGSGTPYAVGFHIDSADVTLRNFTDVFTNSIAIFAGANAKRAVIENGHAVQTRSNWTRRYLLVQPGADNVTFRNFTLGRFYNQAESSSTAATGAMAAVVLDSRGGTQSIQNLTIDNVVFDNTAAAGSCSATDSASNGMTCNSNGIAALNDVRTNGLRIINSTFRGFSGRYPMSFYYANLMNRTEIAGNLLEGNSVGTLRADALIRMPYNVHLTDFFRVHHNVFNGSGTQGVAICYNGVSTTASNPIASNIFIEDNVFDGFTTATVAFLDGGAVTVTRNTFGTQSASQARGSDFAAAEETVSWSTTGKMLMTNDNTSNRKIRTWYPSSIQLVDCQATIQISSTSSGPVGPVKVDVYWTADRTAEVYLGSSAWTATSATSTSLTGVAIPRGGYIRVQTLYQPSGAAQPLTSQFSRVLAVPTALNDCPAAITVNQSVAQADPTSFRSIQFTVESHIPLQTPTPDAFSLAGSTAANARIADVIPAGPTRFTVTAMADASGVIVLSLPAGAVLDSSGLPAEASTSTDNVVTYISPIQRAPDELPLDEGGPPGRLTLSTLVGASAPIEVLAQASDPHTTVAPSPIVILSYENDEGADVSVADDYVQAPDREAEVTYTVMSLDPNYDGLILPPTRLLIHDTSIPPSVDIVVQAWIDVDVGTPETVADIKAHGTRVPTGDPLPVGTVVWWTYEVTNDGLVLLTDVEVTDSVLQHVCSITGLPAGQSLGCVGTGPVDTAAGAP